MQLFGPALTPLFPKWSTFGSLVSSLYSSSLYRQSNMPSDLEMSASSQSDSEPDTEIAYRRGPPQLTHKGNLYTRKEHQDNTRAYSKASIIWQFGDEYARTVNGHRKKYWRCGLCNRTTMLVMTDNSSSGLRHLKENHKIDKDGQRQASQTRVDAAFAAAATVANLVTRFRASTFRYLLIRWDCDNAYCNGTEPVTARCLGGILGYPSRCAAMPACD